MSKRTDQIKLGAFLLFTGHHVAAWRHRDASIGVVGGLLISMVLSLAVTPVIYYRFTRS